jgi:hypothetical protein
MHSTESGSGDISGCGGGRAIAFKGNRGAPDICLLHAVGAYQRLSTEGRDASPRYVSLRTKSRKMAHDRKLCEGYEARQWIGEVEE